MGGRRQLIELCKFVNLGTEIINAITLYCIVMCVAFELCP